MRKVFAGMLMAAALTAMTTTAGKADPYRWCAVYGGRDGGGGTNCGFVTLEQCRATISGIGGLCQHNPFYTGPDEKPAWRARKRTRD
ncbi:MAG: DUF3551 domain-containing protein [Betaproteobacteria bacterium]|nr:DUF3551 domain-containing protein [Betaproteobacteria bacterium]